MKRKMTAGSTGQTFPVFVPNAASPNGLGLGGLAYNSTGLACEYRRQGQSAWTAVALSAGTLGTWSPGGFCVDGGLAGAYEVGLPDAALASAAGVTWVQFRLYGAANMAPVLVEIELDAVNYQDKAAFGLTRLDAAVSSRSTFAGGAVDSVTAPVTVGTNNDKGGYSLAQAFPANFASLGISAGGKVNGVVLCDTLSTYTNNTPQTGDAYAAAAAVKAKTDALPTWPANFSSLAVTAQGGVDLNLAQAVPAADVSEATTQTVGDCLSVARAQGAGRWTFSGTAWTLYGPNDEVVRTFALDSTTAPTERT